MGLCVYKNPTGPFLIRCVCTHISMHIWMHMDEFIYLFIHIYYGIWFLVLQSI